MGLQTVPIFYLMNCEKSLKIEEVKVIKTRKIQGKMNRKTPKITITRGAKEKVWSWIEVKV